MNRARQGIIADGCFAHDSAARDADDFPSARMRTPSGILSVVVEHIAVTFFLCLRRGEVFEHFLPARVCLPDVTNAVSELSGLN